ncbi:MAG: C69 family dipeptidase [Bacteroidales bacterium]|nr:C69 family dipeptidase [Bacteroidales bacterium]
MTASLLAIATAANACTNFLVTKGATTDGSTFVTYAADSHVLYGELYYRAAASFPKGTEFEVIDWDSGRPLGKIKQAEVTYSVVGNMNEYQLVIGETTYGGVDCLQHCDGIIDYGSLIYITLQRAKNAREAIKVMAELVEEYGYASEGESFSIADPDEVWIMEMIGKGKPHYDTIKGKPVLNKKWNNGAVWVARRIPDGYVCAHANQARITTFPMEKASKNSISSKNLKKIFDKNIDVVYAEDVVDFARMKGLYKGTDENFSFSDTYNPVTFSGARACEARVYAFFNRVASGMEKYEQYAMGYDLKNRMPLWIKPDRQLDVHDMMMLMRDHYEGTPMDMTKDVGAGPFKCPYRWRPMSFSVDGNEYIHERATSTQQTGFSFVAQCRGKYPRKVGGVLWFGVDDTYSTVYCPMFCGITEIPECFREGNGNMLEYSETAAFWLFNQVSNFAYLRYDDMIKDIQRVQTELEMNFIDRVRDVSEDFAQNGDNLEARLNNFSAEMANNMFTRWRDLSHQLLVKYIDGNIKKGNDFNFETTGTRPGQAVFPDQPQYPEWWYRYIIENHGSTIKVPKK